MNRAEKQQSISLMREQLESASLVIVTTQSGLTVTEVSNLRRQLRSSEAGYKVMKNTLVRLAVQDSPMSGLLPFLEGPTAIAYSVDPIAAAKALMQFADKNDKIKVVGGVLNGQVLDANAVKALATLPSLDELRAKLIGLISAPATKIATLLQEPAARMARVLNAHGNA
jgi:large subunit ribosomal protein L10